VRHIGDSFARRHVRIRPTLTWNNTRAGKRALCTNPAHHSCAGSWPCAAPPQYPRRGLPQAQDAEGCLSDTAMELILLSIAGTMILLVLQLMEFVHREPATDLACSIRAMARLRKDSETLTTTVSVAAAYASRSNAFRTETSAPLPGLIEALAPLGMPDVPHASPRSYGGGWFTRTRSEGVRQ